jgi:branched-chain amino acid transport system substrate-binding protein
MVKTKRWALLAVLSLNLLTILLAACGDSTSTPASSATTVAAAGSATTAAAAGSATTAAAAGSATTAAAGSAVGEAIKIGVPLPLTGVQAQTGNDLLSGINFAAKQFNKAGGLNGRQVQVITADTQGDPATAGQVATRLITQDNVTALVGGFGSTPDFAMLTAIDRYGKIFMHASSGSTKIQQGFAKKDWYYHVYIWDPFRADALSGFISTLNPKPATVSIVHESGLYGTTGSAEAEIALNKIGVKVISKIPYTTGTPDFTPVIQKLKNDKADVSFMLGFASDNVLLAQQSKTQQLNIKLFINTSAGETLTQYGEEAAQGVATVDSFHPNMNVQGLADWNKEFMASENKPGTNTGNAQGYTAMSTLLNAMKSANSTEQDKVTAKLNSEKFWTPYGMLGYRQDSLGTNHQLLGPENMIVYQYQGKEAIIVWPENVSTGKIKFPFK